MLTYYGGGNLGHPTEQSPPNLDYHGAEFNKLSVDLEQMKKGKNKQQDFSASYRCLTILTGIGLLKP